MSTISASLLLLLVGLCAADVYLHNPRGSNNRNCRNDNNDRRRNGNRLFDSQNNDKGGYSCPRAYPFQRDDNGDQASVDAYGRLTSSASDRHIDTDTFFYYAGTTIPIEWTVQHGCGGNENQDCRIVFQYACNDKVPAGSSDTLASLLENEYLRDGTPVNNNDGDNTNDEATTLIPDNINAAACDSNGDLASPNCAQDGRYGYQENHAYYAWCKERSRNYGLFTADQLPVSSRNSKNRATNTRQNPNGNRHGLECPEERDYYPYWHPSQWKDIAVGVPPNSLKSCQAYTQQSQNVVDKCYCDMTAQGNPSNQPNQEAECAAASGEWRCEGRWGLPAPTCFALPWMRDNHLGNTVTGHSLQYNWTLPQVPGDMASMRCVLRIRYNSTTGDFPQDIDFRSNCETKDNECTRSPVADRDNREELTYIQYFDTAEPNDRKKLSLAVNTNQYARTFQDRTYAFDIKPLPDSIKGMCKKAIHNLNVRGKRGNIVQTYPSVEYDFTPQDMLVEEGECIHMQWIGSDYNPNRNPNNAEGGPYNPNNVNEAKADRSNLLQFDHLGQNHGVADVDQGNHFFRTSSGAVDYAMFRKFAFLDQELDLEDDCDTLSALQNRNPNNRQARERDPRNCAKLNAVRTPYFKGAVVKVNSEPGSYKFMSTRNNNFSNRSQKLKIDVGKCTYKCGDSGLTPAQTAGVVLGVLAACGAMLFAAHRYMGSRHPDKLASMKAAASSATSNIAKKRKPTTQATPAKSAPPQV